MDRWRLSGDWPFDEPSSDAANGTLTVPRTPRSLLSMSRSLGRRRVLNTVWTVAWLRALGHWRRAMSQKSRVIAGVVVLGFLLMGFLGNLRTRLSEPSDAAPVNTLFAVTGLFILAGVFQLAPGVPWFGRRQCVRFGLTTGERALLSLGTNLLGMAFLLAVSNAVLGLAVRGSLPRGLEWATEAVDVLSVVVALTAASPVGVLTLYGGGRTWWRGVWLLSALMVVLVCSATGPSWIAPRADVRAAWSVTVLLVVLTILRLAVTHEPPDPSASTRGKRGPAFSGRSARHKDQFFGWRRLAGAWPFASLAVAEVRMIVRHRQVRGVLVAGVLFSVAGVLLLISLENSQHVFWLTLTFGWLPQCLWIAYFANLLGFSAGSIRRLLMSSESAFPVSIGAKVVAVASLVFAFGSVNTAALWGASASRLSLADGAILFPSVLIGVTGLAASGTVVSLLLPRKPELHRDGSLHCSTVGLLAVAGAWIVVGTMNVGLLILVRELGGTWPPLLMMTVLSLCAVCLCGALTVFLSRASWSRRHLRRWMEAAQP